MRCPSLSEDETGRLRSLAEYELSAERGLPSLDPIVEMAAAMFNCPIAAVNMIGSDHVFLVSKTGLDEYDARRDVSFCAHAINQNDVMVVEDASLDARFHDNPLVTDGPIKFYAGAPLRSPSGHALGALCVIDDRPRGGFPEADRTRLAELAQLTVDRLELRRLEAAAEHGAKRLEASAANSPNAIITFDAAAKITGWNNAAVAMFGRTAGEVIGQPIDMLIADESRQTAHAELARALSGGAPREEGLELTGLRGSGAPFPVDIHVSRWREGDAMHFGAIVRDMTEKRRERDQLYRLANFDNLTGLPNRNLLGREIIEALSKSRQVALIVTDLDGFSDINNTLGHSVGDQVLKLVAERIQSTAPKRSTVARIGGDEFATLLLDEGDPLVVTEVAAAINAALAKPMVADGHEVRIAGTCGMALAPAHGNSVEEIMASASLALFQARSAGRGGSFFYVPALRAAAVARRMHDAELHRAFERDEFTLFYQPVMRLADRSLIGAEALLRWRHPERGVLAPAAFLPAIESGVLAEPVGRWVIETACAQLSEWHAARPDFRIGVNLFAAQFRDGQLPKTILQVLADHGLPVHALELEITENIVLDREQSVIRQLFELREAGFRLAFDDFGTGYASLNLLRSFPITDIKIDKSFTRVMTTSPKDQAIVLSLINLAGELGLDVVAEGIESRDDLEFLVANGCGKGQGFYLGKPAPPEVFEEQFLSSARAVA
jgi:diguanylate cyclase (GGDEF)-like protein/PAS domain S-box-containing protein